MSHPNTGATPRPFRLEQETSLSPRLRRDERDGDCAGSEPKDEELPKLFHLLFRVED
jgi:hypothetical protein